MKRSQRLSIMTFAYVLSLMAIFADQCQRPKYREGSRYGE